MLIFCHETYVVVCTVASIGIKDLRFGADTSSTERYCSVVSISLAAYVLLLPLLIAVLYLSKFKSSNPVKENRNRVKEFGNENIDTLEKEVYT